MQIVKSLKAQKCDLRLRIFNPIIEAYARLGDLDGLKEVISLITEEVGLPIRSEQVALVMEGVANRNNSYEGEQLEQFANSFLQSASENVLGE
jgi:hypothetical protein